MSIPVKVEKIGEDTFKLTMTFVGGEFGTRVVTREELEDLLGEIEYHLDDFAMGE